METAHDVKACLNQLNLNDENIPRENILGFKQPSHDLPRGVIISGPGVGPSGMQPRPLELKRIMPKISRAIEDSLTKAKRFSMEQSASYVLYRQVARQPEICPIIQVNQNQRNRVVNLMCRIYVVGFGYDVREETIKLAFTPFGPIRRVDMSWDSATQNKGFAFVEYEVPDSAELALDQMHDTMISGRPIKVTRPCNAPSTQGMIDGILDEARPYPRIFVANLHPEIKSRDLRAVFETFGKLRSCVVIGERNPVHKGIAYLEFEDHQNVSDAIVSMNLFVLGGQSLRVGKAITLASHMPEDKGLPPAAALAMAAVSAKLKGRHNIPQKPKETALVKKEESILNMPPMETLVSAIASPAMIQAGLSDVAAQLVNSSEDLKSLISPTFKQKFVDYRRRPKPKEVPKKSDKPEDKDRQIDDMEIESPHQTIETEDVVKPSHKDVDDSSRRRRRSRSRSRHRRRISPYRNCDERRKYRRRSRSRSRNGHKRRSRSRSPRRESRRRDEKHDDRHDISQKNSYDAPQTSLEDISIKGGNARLLIMQKLARNIQSNVILMRNLVTSDQVDNRLQSELEQECYQYGQVKQVLINHERQSNAPDSSAIIKIFVQFENSQGFLYFLYIDTEKAHAALNKRYFASKPIRAEFYDQEKFENKDYSG